MDVIIKEESNFSYIEEGDGPPIVFLHGLFGALSNFSHLLTQISKTNRVIIPLLPIYTLPVLDTNVKRLAEFLEDFLAFKGIKNPTLLGNSLGGHVALVYIKRNPNAASRLILTGSSGLYENAMGGGFPRREDYNFIKAKVAETFYDPKHATKELVDECFEIVNNKGKLIRILSLAKSAIRHNMAKDLKDFKLPVCLIWGKNDTITPPEVAEEFHSLLPMSELHWIDQCGHAPMMEQPETFNQILEDWLKKNPA
ncbi:MAG TPA: alpha/beta hydrolase [Luteibaculaceae bacterium]|nr:alpha/beta hydrolase [Luteibaculaceae bacterium]